MPISKPEVSEHLTKMKISIQLSNSKWKKCAREEMDYRFDIILYLHKKFQMFEFPLFPRGRSVTRPKISNKNLTKKPKVINNLILKKTGNTFFPFVFLL